MIITDFCRRHFKPTYLYIKQHSVTGKLYFGKTYRHNVEKYTGSGIHWGRHISIHGRDKVVTLWYCLFTDIDLLVETALKMSEIMDITKSVDWLNFKPESGLDGGSFKGFNGWLGKTHTDEHKEKLRLLYTGKPRSAESKKKMAESWTEYRKTAHRATMAIPERKSLQQIIARRMGEANAMPKEYKLYSCVQCGLNFNRLEYVHHNESTSAFCSKQCAMKEAIDSRKNQKLSCLHCNKIFDVSGFARHMTSKSFINYRQD